MSRATAARCPTQERRSGPAVQPRALRPALLFLLIFALAVRAASALLVPPWQGPDEPKHFEYVRVLVDKREQFMAERRLPNQGDASPQLQGQIIASLAEHNYWERVGWLPSGPTTPEVLPKRFDDIWPLGTGRQLHRPSLYYFLAAAVVWPLQSASLEAQLLAVRLLSVLLSTLTVLCTYLAARRFAPGSAFLPLASAAFVTALPMHVFVGGTANSDNLVTLAGSICTLGLLAGLRNGFSRREWAVALGGMALALAAKRVGVVLVPPVALAALYWLLRQNRPVRLIGLGSIALVILTAVAAWQVAAVREAVVRYALNSVSQFTNLSQVSLASPEVQSLLLRHLAALFCSFWGIFGWFNVLMSVETYAVLAVVTGVCLVGFAIRIGRLVGQSGSDPNARRDLFAGGLLFLTALGATVLVLLERLSYLSPHELPQGRYLFVAIAPIAITLALGASTFLPQRLAASRAPAYAVLAALVTLDLVAYTFYIVPSYGRF